MLLLIFKSIFLFIAVLLTIINVTHAYVKKEVVTENIIWQSIGITGFIILQWL